MRTVLGRSTAWMLVVVLAGCTSTGTTSTGATSTASTTTSAATSTAAQDELDALLAELGIDRTLAPEAAVTLGAATWCGWEGIGLTQHRHDDPAAARCFVEAHLAGEPALVLIEAGTNEGDPLAFVYRTESGVATQYVDATRDPLGSGAWSSGVCGGLTITTIDSTSPRSIRFMCTLPDS